MADDGNEPQTSEQEPAESEQIDLLLPDLLLLSDYRGNFDDFIEAVYERFCLDFVVSPPLFNGLPVHIKVYPKTEGKERGFWHVAQEGPVEDDRLPDIRRCERIGWLAAVVRAVGNQGIRLWEETIKGERRPHIALEDFSYLVVLAARRDHYVLWTGYPVERAHQRNKLRKRWLEHGGT